MSLAEFESFQPARHPSAAMFAKEFAWFKSEDNSVIGSLLRDNSDHDWNFVILGKDKRGVFRWIDGQSSFSSKQRAISTLKDEMQSLAATGQASESLFDKVTADGAVESAKLVFTDVNDALKKYFAQHPEKLHQLNPRKFEELVASILKDFGFEVELTQQTRDGGRDILAYMRNAVVQFLTFVECKRYAPENKVGVGIVRQVTGVHYLYKADKSLIVTTSSFTKDAIEEAKKIEHELSLKDYQDIRAWLSRYK